ncbi:hypothetical protein [Holospora curviuscula]|uniref:Uncharacterized protein n=1 Tax=Holospora curviuscula TaxID=1082868 RepID=A0A2S5RE76_9PROT|nr:hypothetical protein [Holospora curviuscula]PPE05623.1 hypothetical protein HCUR_00271 [Holospora curviuscula]
MCTHNIGINHPLFHVRIFHRGIETHPKCTLFCQVFKAFMNARQNSWRERHGFLFWSTNPHHIFHKTTIVIQKVSLETAGNASSILRIDRLSGALYKT